jgi:flagellar capping protein FliD
MSATDLYSSPNFQTIAATWVDDDAIKTSIATAVSAQSYSGGALNGAIGAGEIDLPKSISITTGANASTYNLVDPIRITGTDWRGQTITEDVLLTNAGGGETVQTTKGFATVTSIAIPAQLTTGGTFKIGILDLVFNEPARSIRHGGAGTIVVKQQNGKSRSLVGIEGERQPTLISRVVAAGSTFPFTVYT